MTFTLITGASGGIGEAIANRLAAQKHNLILVARNEVRLKALAARLSGQHGIAAVCIAADLSRAGAAQEVYEQTREEAYEIGMLINNAGIGSGGEFAELSLESELKLIQLNNASLVAMTHLFLQQMIARKSGTVVNIASMAAFMPVPYMAAYAASKAFVRSFTEAITEECKAHNVQVLLFSPGLTKTNFNAAAGIDNAKGKALNTEYNRFTQTPEQVADEVLSALKRKQHSHISGAMNRFSAKLLAMLPNSMIARYMADNFRRTSKK